MAELEAIVADYLSRPAMWDAVPAAARVACSRDHWVAAMSPHEQPDTRELQFSERDLAIATLVGRYVERRERGDAPCAHDLLAVAAELGDGAVDQLRTCSSSTRRCARARTPADAPTAYGPPPIRFTEADVDQARAGDVLIEFERGRPIIVDRSLYRELVKGAIKHTHDEQQTKAAATGQEKKAARSAKALADPLAAAKRERDAQCASSPTRRTAPTSTSALRR